MCVSSASRGPTMTRRLVGVEMDDIERLAGGDADAAALADRVAQDAVMTAKHAAVDMDDLAGIGRCRPQLGDDVGIFALRHEADVLAVGLGRDRQAHLFGDRADLGLRHAAERKAQIVDLRLRRGEQEIALVAVGVDRPVKRAVSAIGAGADIMPGGQRIGAELLGGRQKIGELDRLVAGDARNRRFAGDVALGEGVDHRLAEALLVVEHIMRNAERFGDAAGIVDVLAGAARAGAVVGAP